MSTNPELSAKERKQIQDLEYQYANRTPPKEYEEGDKVFIKINKRIGKKFLAKYIKEIVT